MLNKKQIFIILGFLVIILAGAWVARFRFDYGAVLGETIQPTDEKLWEYQCIDTMKFSRDAAREFLSNPAKADSFIPMEVAEVKSLGANCVALGTPYDEEFIPILQKWVNAARAEGLSVWFRGNMSGWENWFDYPRFTSVNQHHQGITNFITNHPDLFKEGDIITPAPEAENGIMGNPWRTFEAREELRQFVIASADNCRRALGIVGKNINCGFFSANGDVAEQIYDADSTVRTGGVVVMDHYISTVERMERDIDRVTQKHNAPVMLGEFGAPIPDLNGAMTEAQQEKFVRGLLDVFYKKADKVKGINYWVLRGGSTTLLNDNGSERLATEAIRDYYKPAIYRGVVRNTLGQPLPHATITTKDLTVTANDNGEFKILLPAGRSEFDIMANGYKKQAIQLNLTQSTSTSKDLMLDPVSPTNWYKFQLRTKKFLGGG